MRAPLLLLLAALAACKGSASSGSAAPAPPPSATPPAPVPAPPSTARSPTTKLTGQQLKDAYATTMAGADPFDKELAAVKSKLGEPQKVDGDSSFWWGWSPKEGAVDPTCYELSMSPTQGSSVGGTDWSKCGMAE
jgi:hypothetical protein